MLKLFLTFVCLVFFRQSSAAPTSNEEENPLWNNPCYYTSRNSLNAQQYQPSDAEKLANFTRHIISDMKEYENDITTLASFSSMESLLPFFATDEWLRKFDAAVILPAQKHYGEMVDDGYLTDLMNNINNILPAMNKSLKFLLAGWNNLEQYKSNIRFDESLLFKFAITKARVQSLLCLLNDLMNSRQLQIPTLRDSEFFPYNYQFVDVSVYVYRDTINYLEFIEQIMRKISQTGI